MIKKEKNNHNNKDRKGILRNKNTRNLDSKSDQKKVENITIKEDSELKHEYDLRSFLSYLEKRGELITIHKKVKKKFELAAIISKFDKKEAVMFTNVDESKFKVVSNILGTRERFFYGIESSGPINKIDLSNLGNIGPEYYPKEFSNDAPFYSNSTKNLYDLPIVSHFEKDAGPFITSSTVYVKDQENGNQNSSVHRMLLLNNSQMAIRMVEGRHLHKCFVYAKEHKEDLKINVVVGVHPALNIAAAYQAAYGIDEITIANYLLNGNLKLAKNNYSDLMIPKHSEVVLDGKILHDEVSEEWMVEMLRTYDFKRKQPVFEINKIWYRDNPIYYDILPGYTEHRLLMGLPIEAKIFSYVKNTVPSTRTVHLSDGGSNWLTAVVQIKKRLEGEPKNAILTAFAAHPSLKTAIIVDEDINPWNPVEVDYAVSTRTQADKDFLIITNAKGSSLDPSSDQTNLLTTKLGIDATISLLKDRERFEIAKIPGADNIDIKKYV
ncbi:Phenolic acid decarboxylase subunit C [Candidatus Nitrosocosmicus oleophilus]|uniref:Anhydromevalonate phosphate decarboxylase n=1 Tax=Candidatus Nitrosocosmicus oleophilus TaxID=1353260 RepID=A0A654M202_9ARCH|nr:UbiD family decarboxylase [Candidatus Nitrosocosmicus oleophilus]ALI37768.1 Phenolic acid decarboxylase subunit C [Candidatus Nitrosocosmicus oleophilus]